MQTNVQSNPIYYSLSSFTSGQNSSTRDVVLHRHPGHNGFGIFIGEDVPSGIYIVTVERNSPAEQANIQPGDRIIAVNGQLVSSMTTSPKEVIANEAGKSQSLSLRIRSTDIFETLNSQSNNQIKDNNNTPVKQPPSTQRISTLHTDLER